MHKEKVEALLQLDIITSNASAQKVSDDPKVQMQHVAGTVAMYQNIRSIILKVPDDALDKPKEKSEETQDGDGDRDQKNS